LLIAVWTCELLIPNPAPIRNAASGRPNPSATPIRESKTALGAPQLCPASSANWLSWFPLNQPARRPALARRRLVSAREKAVRALHNPMPQVARETWAAFERRRSGRECQRPSPGGQNERQTVQDQHRPGPQTGPGRHPGPIASESGFSPILQPSCPTENQAGVPASSPAQRKQKKLPQKLLLPIGAAGLIGIRLPIVRG